MCSIKIKKRFELYSNEKDVRGEPKFVENKSKIRWSNILHN